MQRSWLIVLLIAVFLGSVISLFIPWNITGLTSHTNPAQSYEDAVQRISAIQNSNTEKMNPDCETQFMTNGKKVEQVIVMVHGYTNCPKQFQELGQKFFDAGYNVLIAPLPHHGLVDRMTDEQGQMTAQELATYADTVVDIAHGLGEKVIMVGISAGGATTAWAAQNRSDLDMAVIISPAFGFKQVPTPLTAPVMNIYATLPDSYEWWEPDKQANAGPNHTYPRYSKFGLSQTLRIGFSVQTKARQEAPAAKKLLIITNANDESVNNNLTYEITANWRQHGANISTYEFPLELKLVHDLIDPAQEKQQIDLVYPRLIDLITK